MTYSEQGIHVDVLELLLSLHVDSLRNSPFITSISSGPIPIISCTSELCQMDVLIYLQGILADLVVADLNPDCPPTPSFLKKTPDLEMSNNVMHGLRHSSLRPCSLFCPPFTWKARGAFTSAFMQVFFKVKKVSVSSGFKISKSPSVYAVASKDKRTTSPQTY